MMPPKSPNRSRENRRNRPRRQANDDDHRGGEAQAVDHAQHETFRRFPLAHRHVVFLQRLAGYNFGTRELKRYFNASPQQASLPAELEDICSRKAGDWLHAFLWKRQRTRSQGI